MHTKGNTILITGGGTGIGLGLAKSFHELGNKVIIASRRRELLDEVVKKCPGMASYGLDIQKPDEIKSFAEWLKKNFPALNVLINNAGIMKTENLTDQRDFTDMEAIVATNLLGPMRLTAALIPLLVNQPHATIMNVSSGLAFVPMATAPTYCATKAAMHSYTQSLRHQLKYSKIQVIELIPPYVSTHLMHHDEDPGAMPVDLFISEVMEIVKHQHHIHEICVENVKHLRMAAEAISYEKVYRTMNHGR
jgi:uncharacterized oxidoreductase